MISHTGLLQINASAGSGKTYTLAKRYIELLLFAVGNDGLLHYRPQMGYHSHILAITFTNKATAEMKKRIIDELYLLATNPSASDFFRDFMRESSSFAPDVLQVSQVQKAAQQALSALLFDYGAFNVSTIDSFFQSILRNFARELDRDYSYEVQIDESVARSSAIHNFLLSLGTDSTRFQPNGKYVMSDIEKWVQDHIRRQVDIGKSWNFFKDGGVLNNFARMLTRELFRNSMNHLHEYLTRVHEGERISDLGKVRAFQKHIAQLADQYEHAYKALPEDLETLLKRYDVDKDNLWTGRTIYNALKQDNKFVLGENALPDEVTEEKVNNSFKNGYTPSLEMVKEVLEWGRRVVITWNVWRLFVDLQRDLGMLALLDRIDENVKQYSRETNQLLIADTNDLIERVLRSGVPFIYERVGTWINHFMIDEFQDTSSKQFSNFRPLLEEALSHRTENLCMLIGDAKQAIYRFRNADPSLFREGIAKIFTPQQHGYVNLTLDTNYRSCPAIVRFNNWLFEKILKDSQYASSSLLKQTFMPRGMDEDFQQKLNKKEPLGMVNVTFIDDDKETTDGEAKANAVDKILSHLPEYLLDLHKRFDWGDIGILVNTGSDGRLVVNRIMEHNLTAPHDQQISITSDESMYLSSSPSVKRIISLLQFIDLTQFHYGDSEEQAAEDMAEQERLVSHYLKDQRLYYVLAEFMKSMTEDEHDASGSVLAKCFRDIETEQGETEQQLLKHFAAEVRAFLPDSSTELLTLTNIVEHIIAKYFQNTANDTNETAYLLAFQDCVSDFSTKRSGGTVREFLRYWENEGQNITVPSSVSDNSVTVMTIHKSKGLEFQCLVIPFASWSLVNEGGTNQDRLNLLYWVTKEDMATQGLLQLINDKNNFDEELIPPLLPLKKSCVNKLAKMGYCLTQFVDSYQQNVLIDNMDKTYVAFTRPREEMHIFVYGYNDLPNLMRAMMKLGVEEAATNPDVMLQQLDENTYRWGEPRMERASEDKQDDVEIVSMPPYRVAAAAQRPQVRLPKDQTDKASNGKRLHNLLSRIAYRRDVERALAFCLNRGIIHVDDKEWPLKRIRAFIDKMFDDPRMIHWFADDNKVYNERNLVFDNEAELELKRPDRVVKRPDGTWLVIDYKFGTPRNKDVEQVREYMQLLHDMGKASVQGHIWYVALEKIVPVQID